MFYDIFKKLCDEKGIAPSRAAEEVGISRGTVSSWKSQGFNPYPETVKKIADYFNVSVAYLRKYMVEDETGELLIQKQHDIKEDIDQLKNELNYTQEILLEGEPLNDLARKSLLDAIRIGLDAAKHNQGE